MLVVRDLRTGERQFADVIPRIPGGSVAFSPTAACSRSAAASAAQRRDPLGRGRSAPERGAQSAGAAGTGDAGHHVCGDLPAPTDRWS